MFVCLCDAIGKYKKKLDDAKKIPSERKNVEVASFLSI